MTTLDLSSFGLRHEKALSLVANGARRGVDFVEVFLDKRSKQTLNVRNSKSDGIDQNFWIGAGVRVIHGYRVGYVHTTDVSVGGLNRAIDLAVRSVEPRSGVDRFEIAFSAVDFGKFGGKEGWHNEIPSLEEMNGALLSGCGSLAQGVNHFLSASISFLSDLQEVAVIASDGVAVRDIRLNQSIGFSLETADGARRSAQSERVASSGNPRFLEQTFANAEPLLDALKVSSGHMLYADAAPSGQFPVVLAPGSGGVILHEACGHLLESYSVRRGVSPFATRLNEQVAPDAVSAVDEGSTANAFGSLEIDDEGMPTQTTDLIRNGKLVGFLSDRVGEIRAGIKRTGSARRQDFRFLPTARMRNTYLRPGPHSAEEILASVDHGVYCKRLGGGSVDSTGDFNFGVKEAWEIKSGKLTRPLKGAILIGSGPEILQRISMVAGDRRLSPGFCGAISGRVYVTHGLPTTKVDSLTIGGR